MLKLNKFLGDHGLDTYGASLMLQKRYPRITQHDVTSACVPHASGIRLTESAESYLEMMVGAKKERENRKFTERVFFRTDPMLKHEFQRAVEHSKYETVQDALYAFAVSFVKAQKEMEKHGI